MICVNQEMFFQIETVHCVSENGQLSIIYNTIYNENRVGKNKSQLPSKILIQLSKPRQMWLASRSVLLY